MYIIILRTNIKISNLIKGSDNMYFLQTRWKLENDCLIYYGLRNKENMFKNKIKLNKDQITIVKLLPKELSVIEKSKIHSLIGKQVVLEENIVKIPTSINEARFCTNCVANDYMIPGIEFNEDGLCPMCQTKLETKDFQSVVPIMNKFPKSKKSRFDVAVFYTGGKDSTYLLYYLSKVLNLKVLALTWELPYMSSSALKSIESAKTKLDNVEFITRYVNNDDLRKMYRLLYSLSENTCACPSLAYVLFYPELVANKVPYFIAGNEPAQLQGLYYNHMAPKIAYKFANNKFLNVLINFGRIITLHPPLKKGQFHTLMTMKQLANKNKLFMKISGYKNELLNNVVCSINSVNHMVTPLKRAIRASSWSGNIPAFVQVDFNEIAGGKYDWRKVKDTIIKECGWHSPEEFDKGLHTSCKIEKCKEYSQFQRFYYMRSTMIPFSAIEISLATREKCLSKEEAIKEINGALGFSIEEIPECQIMKGYFKQ